LFRGFELIGEGHDLRLEFSDLRIFCRNICRHDAVIDLDLL
jgi:hypothetical protein